MNFSVVIVTHNEERDLEVTATLAWASVPEAYEIVVVDDHSKLFNGRTVAERLATLEGVKVVSPPVQLGPWPARRFGASFCKGDAIVFLDSHMRMPLDWLEYAEQAIEVFPDSIFCCANRGFNMRTPFLGCGARFTNRVRDLFMNRRWLTRGDLDAIDWCPCVLGACYVVPTHVWRSLDGTNPNFQGWGSGEQDLSLRSWMFGFDVRRINGLCVQHRYHRTILDGTFMNKWQAAYNQFVMAATVFEDGVFERLYEPFFRRAYEGRAAVEFEAQYAEIMLFRKFVQEKRRFSDGELQSLCDFRLPTEHQQRMTVDAILQKRARRGKNKVVQAGQ